MIRALFLIPALVVLTADLARGGDVVECRAVPQGRAYWSWREVEGRRCYYAGRPGKSKNELHWRSVGTPQAPVQQAGQPEAAHDAAGPEAVPDLSARASERQSPPEKEPAWQATMEDQLLAFTCCWPEPPTAERSVERSLTTPTPKTQDRYDAPITIPKATPPVQPLWPFMLLMVGLVAGSILLAKRRLT